MGSYSVHLKRSSAKETKRPENDGVGYVVCEVSPYETDHDWSEQTEPRDINAVIVYLHGGYTWLPTAGWDTYRVRRGDIDVLPANTIHTFGNAGGDPLEFLAIFPK